MIGVASISDYPAEGYVREKMLSVLINIAIYAARQGAIKDSEELFIIWEEFRNASRMNNTKIMIVAVKGLCDICLKLLENEESILVEQIEERLKDLYENKTEDACKNDILKVIRSCEDSATRSII